MGIRYFKIDESSSYLFVSPMAKEAIEFYKTVFGAKQVFCRKSLKEKDQILSCQLNMGSYSLFVSDWKGFGSYEPSILSTEVPNVRATMDKAIDAGAKRIVSECGEACFLDPYGLSWILHPVIAGFKVQVFIPSPDIERAIQFYTSTFNAEVLKRKSDQAEMKIGNSVLLISSEDDSKEGKIELKIEGKDSSIVLNNAVAAGAVMVDDSKKIKDPFAVEWVI